MTSPSQSIIDAINRNATPLGRHILLYGTRMVLGSAGAQVQFIGTVTGPHLIRAVQWRGGQLSDANQLCDVLISHDTAVDANAQLRDAHVSGLSGLNAGLVVSTSPLGIVFNLLVNRAVTHYKLFTYNASVNNAMMQNIIELTVRGTR